MVGDELKQQLRQVYVKLIDETRKDLENAFARLKLLASNPKAIATCHRLCHNMKGTGTSYGYPIVSAIGATMDDILKQYLETTTPIPAEMLGKLDAYLDVLFECFEIITEGGGNFSGQETRIKEI